MTGSDCSGPGDIHTGFQWPLPSTPPPSRESLGEVGIQPDPGSAHQTPGPSPPLGPWFLPKGHGPAASHRYLPHLSLPSAHPELLGLGLQCTPTWSTRGQP